MQQHEPNLSVMESRLIEAEKHIDHFFKLSEGQSKVNANLERLIGLLERSIERYETEDRPKLNKLWENRSQIAGGWIVISVLGGIVTGGGAVGGLVYAVMNHGK